MFLKKDFIFSVRELNQYLESKKIKSSFKEIKHPFSMMVPKYYLDLINWNDTNDPIRKMVITSSLENDIKKYELVDPIGDKMHEPVPGVVHRHKDRCLLMLTSVCAVHCRFCFRKSLLKSNTYDYKKSIEYIKKHTEIWEIILSGGDPFMLTDKFLNEVITALKQIKHIKLIRFHTRTPAVYPKRVTKDFTMILSKAKPLVIVFHINHPNEITPEFLKSLLKLRKTGAILLSQTVLLKGVNDNSETLIRLFRRLVESGIKPYYLHHLDYAYGTHYFRVSIKQGRKIYSEVRNQVSGHTIPEYVIDVPGGLGKIPVFWFKHISHSKYQVTGSKGRKITYQDFSD